MPIVIQEQLHPGDIVTLKSAPDQPMTVMSVVDGEYLCAWIYEGSPMKSVYPREALAGEHVAKQERDAHAMAQAVDYIASELESKTKECEELHGLVTELMKDRAAAIKEAFRVYPEALAESALGAVGLLATRYETIKREANETIERLKKTQV